MNWKLFKYLKIHKNFILRQNTCCSHLLEAWSSTSDSIDFSLSSATLLKHSAIWSFLLCSIHQRTQSHASPFELNKSLQLNFLFIGNFNPLAFLDVLLSLLAMHYFFAALCMRLVQCLLSDMILGANNAKPRAPIACADVKMMTKNLQ